MPINAVCPECRASYVLADQQNGKKVRCKKCQAVFVAGTARTTKVEEPLDVEVVAEPPRPKPRPAPASVTTTRRTTPTRVERDEDEDRRPRRRDRDDFDDPPRRGSALPWAIAGIVVGLLLLIGGVVAIVLVKRGGDSNEQASSTPAATTPATVEQPLANPVQPIPPANTNPNPNANPPPQATAPKPIEPQPVKTPDPPVKAPDLEPARPPAGDPPPAAGNGQISPQMVGKVKRATVYLKVTMADDAVVSGTGFFGAAEARNLILTNAHVVGMLSPDSRRPRAIEVFINSGQPDERKTTARVLGVDRVSDLAVLDVGTTDNMPEPLTVKSAADLVELTKLYTFGFPLGERLGKEITIRETSVGALRKKNGALDRIQVNGGMDPGNSGGPVVDGNGHVVGVAVSGYEGRLINFAIPGDRVHAILNGRISAMGLGMAYYAEDRRIAFPLNIEMIDPRNRIKEVALDVWTGNAPPDKRDFRPAADAQPAAEAGDSQHLRYKVPYDHGLARGDIVLPELPAGKVFWIQPNWINAAGEAHWASAKVWKPPSDPVERTPAALTMRLGAGFRSLNLIATRTYKVRDSDDDDDTAHIVRTEVTFKEQATPNAGGGGTLRLQYSKASSKEIEDKKTRANQPFEAVKADLPHVTAIVYLDAQGSVTGNGIDPQLRTALQRSGLAGRARFQQIFDFHSPIQAALEALSVPLPGREVKPMETWKGQRPLPIDKGGHRRFESGKLDLVFTYLGQRKRNGRDEAVIAFEGAVLATPGAGAKEVQLGGKATGTALVDLATGLLTMTETRLAMEIDLPLKLLGKDDDKTVRLLAIYVSRLERGQ